MIYKKIIDFLLFKKLYLISSFLNRVKDLKIFEKLYFQFSFLSGFNIFINLSNFITCYIFFSFDVLMISLFLKSFSIVEIFLINKYGFVKFCL